MENKLPSLNIEVEGKVIATNLDEYRDRAIAIFDNINTDLKTDQDFQDAADSIKFCQEIESKLKAAKEHALSQTASIDQLFSAIDEISESARQKRLVLTRLEKEMKQSRILEINDQAVTGLKIHYEKINQTIEGYNATFPVNFSTCVSAAMKGKRTISSLVDAADQVLSEAKIEASEKADLIRANLINFKELAINHKHLFSDWKDLIEKPTDDFVNTVKIRIAEHEKAEQDRLEAERERIREEELAKLARIEADRVKATEEELAKAGEAEIKKADDEELQTEPEAATPARTNVALTEYQRGYVDGLTAFAWWKSGEQFVGTSGTTLNEAIKKFLASGQH